MPTVTVIEAEKPMEQKTSVRVAAYCRVSTAKNNQQHSCETQQHYFHRLLEGSPHEQLVRIYADYGSGTSTDQRPDFRQMMEDCRSHKIDRIITKSLSRFARNTHDCLVALRELKQLGVTVLFDKEGIDTAKVSDEILLTILEGLAQEESASISGNIRWSLQRKMADGTLGIARVPYGYQKDEHKQLQIDEKKAAIVRRIYALYLSGTGAHAIALLLNRDGIPSPTGIRWNNITILKMLRQEKYIGDIHWQKTYSVFMGPKGRINHGEQDSFYIRNCLPLSFPVKILPPYSVCAKKIPVHLTMFISPFSVAKPNAPAAVPITMPTKAVIRYGSVPAVICSSVPVIIRLSPMPPIMPPGAGYVISCVFSRMKFSCPA